MTAGWSSERERWDGFGDLDEDYLAALEDQEFEEGLE